ncbi:SpaH/EbpB family LPXTG-anchored major pilin [Staphylococcus chromogenes]|nr:SpaH/EbpB family LPXTG-anchored major pilin [Staphylococcus chromogenes]
MKQHNTSSRKRIALNIVTTAMLVGMSASMSPVAWAQGTDTIASPDGTINATMVSLIDGNKTGSLTIHKYLGDPTKQTADGTDISVAGTPYVAKFRVSQILNLDPTKIEDWEKYSKLTVDAPGALGPAQEIETINGVGTLANLPLGFYKVEELPQASNQSVSRTTIAPFLTAIPMTDLAPQPDPNAPTKWRYDVHVHPKNQELKVTKDVVDSGKQLGDTVSYTIKADIPAPPNDPAVSISSFKIVDRWETNEIQPDLDSIQVSAGVDLIRDVDYNVSAIETPVSDAPAYSQIWITLTDSGLKKVSDARRNDPKAQVMVQLNAKIVGVWGTSAENQAHFLPPTGNIVIDIVESKYGKIQLKKLSGADKSTPLAGATFSLYRCNQGTTDLISNQKVVVNGQSEWTTDTNGLTLIDGVHLEDFENGAPVTDSFDYCVIETKAPNGYELNPKPISVPVNQTTDSASGIYFKTADVFDYPTNGGFKLPETGAAGVAGLIAGGGLIAALAVFMNRRKAGRAEQQLLGS